MKPSSRCALAAALCLAALAPSCAGSPAFAAGFSFAGRPAMGQGGHAQTFRPVQRPAEVRHGFVNTPIRQAEVGRARVRIVHRFWPVYGSYAPYYGPAVPETQPEAAPVVVETETPVNVNIGGPAAPPQACSGPQIIELGKPAKAPFRLPRVIYGTPVLPCVAARAARRGPGIYSFD